MLNFMEILRKYSKDLPPLDIEILCKYFLLLCVFILLVVCLVYNVYLFTTGCYHVILTLCRRGLSNEAEQDEMPPNINVDDITITVQPSTSRLRRIRLLPSCTVISNYKEIKEAISKSNTEITSISIDNNSKGRLEVISISNKIESGSSSTTSSDCLSEIISSSNSGSSGSGSDECIICLTAFKDPHLVRKLSCEHYYHMNCVDKWIINGGTCPICRMDAFALDNQLN